MPIILSEDQCSSSIQRQSNCLLKNCLCLLFQSLQWDLLLPIIHEVHSRACLLLGRKHLQLQEYSSPDNNLLSEISPGLETFTYESSLQLLGWICNSHVWRMDVIQIFYEASYLSLCWISQQASLPLIQKMEYRELSDISLHSTQSYLHLAL